MLESMVGAPTPRQIPSFQFSRNDANRAPRSRRRGAPGRRSRRGPGGFLGSAATLSHNITSKFRLEPTSLWGFPKNPIIGPRKPNIGSGQGG